MAVASTDTLLRTMRQVVPGADRGAARAATAGDAVDGVQPRLVAEPATADAVAAMLAWASSERLTVMVIGGRSKLGWGAPSGPIDLALSTRRLGAVVEHRHGDLTATVEAGATLASVNATLAAHRQWLPWDPPWPDRATIGGIVATNDSGPRRHRFGAPRDSIIGVTVARVDGDLAKAGGIVVKNVAGYDLSRLLTGSFGCLGVIVTATFKLSPVAPASRTVEISLGSLAAAAPVVRDLGASALTPTALELAATAAATQVLVRFESVAAASARQAAEARDLVGPRGSVRMLEGEEETAAWDRHAAHWAPAIDGTVLKVSCVPAEVMSTLVWLQTQADTSGVEMAAAGRAGLGVVDVCLHGSLGAQAGMITELRRRLPIGRGSAVIRSGDAALRRRVDAWGPIGDGFRVMQAVKRRFDPDHRLNPGRGPGGL